MAARFLNSIFAAVILATMLPVGVIAIAPPDPNQFVGTTPCDVQVRRFIGIAVDAACDRISWRLELSRRPSTFTLTAAFGLQESSGPGFVNGGDTARLNGSWTTVTGTRPDPNAVVYRLTDASSGRSVSLAKIGGNLLHLLSENMTLAVGNASWSYTLSTTAVRHQDMPAERAGDAPVVKGVFEGRTPCQELARQFGVSVPADCFKLKWRLTLFDDPATGAPTTYKLEGTLYRSRPLVGKWSMVRDTRAQRTVYHLNLNGPATLSFVKADDNILFLLDATGAYRVGNDTFSYTFNRSGD
jgi:hypothetical protein